MAYSEDYAERVRLALAETPNVSEQKMFGSLGFMINGHLTVGIGDGSDGSVIMVRVDREREDDYLKEPGTSTSTMGKKVMRGWIDLSPESVQTEEALQNWVMRAVDYVESLPPKGK